MSDELEIAYNLIDEIFDILNLGPDSGEVRVKKAKDLIIEWACNG